MSPTRRLLATLRPYTGLFGVGLFGEFLASALDGFTVLLLVPLLNLLFGTAGALAPGSTALEPVINRLLAPVLEGTTPGQAAGRLVLLLVGVLVVKNTLAVLAQQASAYVEEGVVRDLRRRLFGHLLRVDLAFFQRTRVGQVVASLVSDTDGAKTFIPTVLASLVRHLVMILALLAVLMGTSWRLTALTLASAPVLILGVRWLLRHLKRHSREWTRERADLTGRITERLGAIKLIRAYGREGREEAAFAEETDRYRRRVVRTHRYAAIPSPLSEVFGGLVIILIIWASTKPALVGVSLGPTMTIVFVITALRIMSPLKALSQVPGHLALARASADRVFALLDEPAREVDEPGALPAAFGRDLVFDAVSFRYSPGEELVLHDVSFTVRKGEVVAIVGPSGAGKTTLLDLVPRLHEPTGGEIRMDGTPLSRLSRPSLRALIGLVGQETVLLNDTVLANIAYGRPDAGRERVEAAAAAANAAEFIAELPEGYDTVLGERGMRLSGGQRQRIAIARALLRDPPLLILDEATSALDPESERLVQDAIDRLMRDRTVLVVAHRLATVRRADRILVLDGGRLVEQGTHAALMTHHGLYRRLHDLQFRLDEVPA